MEKRIRRERVKQDGDAAGRNEPVRATKEHSSGDWSPARSPSGAQSWSDRGTELWSYGMEATVSILSIGPVKTALTASV